MKKKRKKASDLMGIPKCYFWSRLEIDNPKVYEVVWAVVAAMSLASIIISVIVMLG